MVTKVIKEETEVHKNIHKINGLSVLLLVSEKENYPRKIPIKTSYMSYLTGLDHIPIAQLVARKRMEPLCLT